MHHALKSDEKPSTKILVYIPVSTLVDKGSQ